MALLFPNEILMNVKQELVAAEDSVQIITAYCKEKTIRLLDSFIPPTIDNKSIMLRFRMDDILKGSTDFSVLQYCLDSNWRVYIRFDLHAKTYIVDNKRGLVGSANATNSGLNTGSRGNLEVGTLVEIEPKDVSKIEKLFKDSIQVDYSIKESLEQQLSQTKKEKSKVNQSWNKDILKLFRPQVDSLFSFQLPEQSCYKIGDYIEFLEMQYDGDDAEFKKAFSYSPSYQWLLRTLEKNEGCLYFGKLSELLHNVLVEDPRPYRKDVKIMLANLLTLIDYLEMDDIAIDRPNYSQRIQLK